MPTSVSDRRHSLSQLLYSIRSQLPDPIEARRDRLRIGRAVTSDYADLVGCLEHVAPERRLLSIEGRGFLDDVHLADSPLYERWREDSYDALVASIRRRGFGAVQSLLNRGQYEVAVHVAEWCLFFGYDVDVGWGLVYSLACAGQLSRARQEYNVLLDFVRRTPGFSVDARMKHLGVQLSAASKDAGLQSTYPFVGREKDTSGVLQLATTVLDAKASGLCLLFGESGVGKTRFLERISGHLTLRGFTRLEARCSEFSRQIAYGTTSMLLNALARRGDVTELGTIWQEALRAFDSYTGLSMSEALASMPALPDSAAKYRMFEAVAQLFQAMCDTCPLVIVIDDSQLIDDSSQELLRYVMTRLKDEPILAVLSFLPITASHPLPSWTARIDARTRRVLELAPLPESDMRRLSATVNVGFGSSDAMTESTVRAARGNPLALIQLLTRYQQVPPRRRRIDALDPANCVSRVLSFLAAAGTALSASELRKLCLHSDLDIDAALLTLEEEGTIQAEAGGFTICHSSQREEVLRFLSSSDSIRIHAQLAGHYAASSAPPAVIARHLFDAEDYSTAVQYALTAAAQYEAVLAFSEAAQALSLCLHVPGIDNVAALHVRIGNDLMKAGSISAADEAFGSVLDHGLPSVPGDLLLRATIGRILVANSRTLAYPEDELIDLARVASNAVEAGLVAEALKVYRIIAQSAYHTQNESVMYVLINRLEQLSSARPHDCSVQFLLASIVSLRSRRKALNISQRACRTAKHQRFSDELIHGQRVYATSLLHNGMVHKSLDVCRAALGRAEQSGAVVWLPGLLNDYGVVLLEAGRASDATTHFNRVAEWQAEGFFAERALASLNLAVLYFETGNHPQVLKQIGAAIEHGLHTPLAESVGYALIGLNCLRSGDMSVGKECYEALTRLQSSLAGAVMGDPYYIDVFRSRFLAAIGDCVESERLLRASIRANRRRYLLPTLRLKLERVELFGRDKCDEVERIQRKAERYGAALLASRAAAVAAKLR